MRRHAFTLIELLVVIAIIAILAAILFPVFAQAKVAAKGAASISNAKQHILSWHMYADDYDDIAVPMCNSTPSPLLFDGMDYSPWGWLLNPYRKNPQVTQDPLVRPNPAENGIDPYVLWPFRPQYGYAYSVWAPIQGFTGNGNPTPIKLTQAQAPADTVVFTSRKDRLTLDWRWVGAIIWHAQTVAPPYCGGGMSASANTNVNPQSQCAINHRWGVGGHGALSPYPSDVEGGRTGSVALRKAMQSVVAFSDGHVKTLPPSRIAAGTNWHWNIQPAQIQMVDITKYMWDLD
jgi:prepilin-type N-terminal cleavage/methylation domain-containing protein